MARLSLLTILILLSISSSMAAGRLGGRTKIPDVETNKEIQAMGRYSVDEYNRQRRSEAGSNDGHLTFSRVVEAEKQVVAGMKYYLKIETTSGHSEDPKVFKAVVEVKPWLHSKQLLKFTPTNAGTLAFGRSVHGSVWA